MGAKKAPASDDGRLRAFGFGLSPPASAVARGLFELTPGVGVVQRAAWALV